MKNLSKYSLITLALFALFIGCSNPETPTIAIDTTPPEDVQNLSWSPYGSNSILLGWNEPRTADYAGVNVYINGSYYQNLIPGTSSLILEDLQPGEYTIKVKTLDYFKNLSEGVSTTLVLEDNQAPDEVSDLQIIQPNQGSLTLAWQEPLTGDYSAVKLYLNGTLLKEIPKGTIYTEISGLNAGSHSFVLKTLDARGNESRGRGIFYNWSLGADKTPPSEITNLLITQLSSDSVRLEWQNPRDSDFASLQIFCNWNLETELSSGETSVVLNGLPKEQECLFIIRTIDSTGNGSAGISQEKLLMNISAPAEVTNLTALQPSTGTVTLNWTDPADQDLYKIQVYFLGNLIDEVSGGVETLSFSDLELAREHNFVLRTIDWAGNLSTGESVAVTPITHLDDFTYTVSGGEATINSYSQLGPVVVVPETIEGAPVTSIANRAFRYKTTMTKVILPDSIISIGESAFESCRLLESINFPANLKTIGTSAFINCSALQSLSLPNGLLEIGNNAFNNASSLTSVTFPDSLTTLGEGAFRSCSSLTAVELPDPITVIGPETFRSCSSMTTLVLPAQLTTIGDSAFNYCQSLTSISFNDKLENIGSYAFAYCDGLTSLVLPDSIKTIPRYAFTSTAFTDITLPASLESMVYDSFGRDPITNGFTIAPVNAHFSTQDGVLFNKDGTTLIRCQASVGNYQVPNGVTTIESNAFGFNSGLQSLVVPETVISISSYAFSNCVNLTSVVLPNSLTTLESGLFNNCSSLSLITLGSNLDSVSTYTFYNCSALTEINLGSALQSIGSQAFKNCTALTSITVLAPVPPDWLGTPVFPEGVEGRFFYVPSGSLTAYQNHSSWGTLGSQLKAKE